MSLESEWDAAVPVGTKPGADLTAEWAKAKPVTFKPPKQPEDDLVARAKQSMAPPLALGEGMANMATGMIAKPVSDIAGLAATGKEMISPGGGNPQDFQHHVAESMTYQPRTPGGAAVAQYNPLALLGKLFGWAGEKGGRAVAGPNPGPARAALGSGVEEAIQQSPAFIGLKAPPVVKAAGEGLKDFGRGTMQSALKPDKAARETGKAASGIETMLNEGYGVTRGSADALRERITTLDDRVKDVIANSPATIDKTAATAHMHDLVTKFEKQVTPLTDVRAIQKAWDEFLTINPDKIPVQTAQEMKTGTYRALKDKAYGELQGADIEAQKTLARGLKDAIAQVAPEVRPLNAEMSPLINSLSLIEKRLLLSANKNPVGLGWMTTNPAKFAAWMADRSELFKSLIARMIYSTGKAAQTPLGSVAAPATGIAASQLQPPPPEQRP